MLEILIALVFPFVNMLFITRVTYNKYVALFITIAILFVGFDAHTQTPIVIIIGAISTLAGFIGSIKLIKER